MMPIFFAGGKLLLIKCTCTALPFLFIFIVALLFTIIITTPIFLSLGLPILFCMISAVCGGISAISWVLVDQIAKK